MGVGLTWQLGRVGRHWRHVPTIWKAGQWFAGSSSGCRIWGIVSVFPRARHFSPLNAHSILPQDKPQTSIRVITACDLRTGFAATRISTECGLRRDLASTSEGARDAPELRTQFRMVR